MKKYLNSGLGLCIVLVPLLLVPTFAQEDDAKILLVKDRRVFVEKADKDADVAMVKELQNWGRWKIVADESEAELLVRLRVSGSAAWGVGHIQASILDAKTKKTLWTSKDQRGTRTVFHGYASPFTRAISGIAKQMKKEIK